nr:helix-turn-helix domain-containing protein [Rodentibacter rarus]
MLQVSRSWLWEQSKAGKFPKPVKFGRLARYPVEAVERYLAQQNHTAEKPHVPFF